MNATHSYNSSSTRQHENNNPSGPQENQHYQHQPTTTTRFLPPIDVFDDSMDEEEDNDMPPGIMVDELPPLPPSLFMHGASDEDMPPPGIIVNNDVPYPDRREGELDDDLPSLFLSPASLIRNDSSLSDDRDTPSGSSYSTDNHPVTNTYTGPLTFNYTFLPDMSLATASDGSPGARITEVTSTVGEYNSGNITDLSLSTSSGAEHDSGGIHSVAYPAYSTSYPPTSYHHIPRPPNAFILFRSAFIRSRKISSEIEGNHSTLSKIIGRVWRSLPPPERAEWEARARLAQEEHRLRYPDWRFSPAGGANGASGGNSRSKGTRKKGRGKGRGRGRLKVGQGGGENISSGTGNEDRDDTFNLDKGEGMQLIPRAAMSPVASGSGSGQLSPFALDISSNAISESAAGTAGSSKHSDSNDQHHARALSQNVSTIFDTSSHLTAISGAHPLSSSLRGSMGNPSASKSKVDVGILSSSSTSEQRNPASNALASNLDQITGKEQEIGRDQPQEQGHSVSVAIDSSASATKLIPTATIKNETDVRVDVIADMLARGYEGQALEVAVREWEVADRKEKEKKERDRRNLDRKDRRLRRDKEKKEQEMKAKGNEKGKAREMEAVATGKTIARKASRKRPGKADADVESNTDNERMEREIEMSPHQKIQDSGRSEDYREEIESRPRRSYVSALGVGEGAPFEDPEDLPNHHGWFDSYNPAEVIEAVGEVPSTSRSSSSNETERERGRAGGEWGFFNVSGGTFVEQNYLNPANTTPIPLTRMFLKRSLSEPAAPRPTRPRLQLTPEENIGNEPRESSLHDEEGNHAGYDFGQQTLPSSTPAEDSYSSSLFSSVSTGGEYRHHANSYPAPSLGPVRGRSTYRSSPHPYPLPSSGTIWASPRMQNSPNVVTGMSRERSPAMSISPTSPPASSASTSSSDSSSTMTLAVPSTSYSSLSSALPASGDYRDYDNDGSSRGSLIEERSMSGSPIRSQISSVPLSGPLQFPSTDTHSDEIQQRRRAWSIRSTLTPQHTLPRFFGYHRSAENINSNITDGSFSFAPDNALSNQRPVSRASLPPSRPGSPIGSEFQPGRRNVFPKQSHRRTSTWGEHWSYLRPPNHDSSPSPSPSASPHREPMSSSVGSAQTPLSWQQVETERRREFVTGFMMESQEEGDPATQITDKEKDVDLAQLMSTDKMGWEQRLPVWPIHQSVLSAEVAGTSTEIQSQAHDTISWTPASPGRTGYVTSIVDPHLYDSESYHQSSKPHQEHVNVPSSSYSTLSGWAGEELDNRIMDPSSPDTFYSSRPGVIGEPVMVFTTPSPLYRLAHLPETSLESQRKPLPEDAE